MTEDNIASTSCGRPSTPESPSRDVVEEPEAVRLRMSSRPLAVVFGSETRQLAGLLHLPNPDVARDTAVVLCNPLGYESMCAHRTMRHLAERLASAGIAALRFDYAGTGDSSGRLDECVGIRGWQEDIGAAIEEVRRVTGVTRVVLFGLRFGAALAALVAEDRGDVDGLVMWAPSVSGKAYVRELRALRLLRQTADSPAASAPSARYEEIAGYAFLASTMTELATVDLLTTKRRLARRALLIPRDDMKGAEERWAKHLAASGTETLVRNDVGYAQAMRDPQETRVPLDTLDQIVAWTAESTTEVPTHPIYPSETPALLVDVGGSRAPLKERAVRFGTEGRLFGILTEADVAGVGEPTVVIFLNVGANHHVGPSRMYVSLSRELARMGYSSLRFDLSGIGESPPLEGHAENRPYAPEATTDVKEAITFVSGALGTSRAILVGICSGAYVAFHASAEDPRVVGQILVNPQTFEWNEGDSLELAIRESRKSTRYYMNALRERSVWAHALRGEVDVRSVADALRFRILARAEVEIRDVVARLRGRPAPVTHVEKTLGELSNRGVESLLVFSESDGGLDVMEQHLGPFASRVRKHARIRLTIVEDADHTFTPAKSQRALAAVIRSYLQRSFPRAAPSWKAHPEPRALL